MRKKIKRRSLCLWLLVILLLYGSKWCRESAADATVVLSFGFSEETFADQDRSGSGHQAQELFLKTSVLTASMPKEVADSKKDKREQAAEDRTEEEANTYSWDTKEGSTGRSFDSL